MTSHDIEIQHTCLFNIRNSCRYCLADDRLSEAVNFLDLGDGAGWELLQVCLYHANCSYTAAHHSQHCSGQLGNFLFQWSALGQHAHLQRRC